VRHLGAPLLAAVLLLACGAPTQGGTAGQPTPTRQTATPPSATATSSTQPIATQSPTPAGTLLEVRRDGQVVLVDLAGHDVASTPPVLVSSNGFVGIVPVGAGGDRAAFLDTRTGILWALHRDGAVERLATTTISYTHVLLSPDGQQWAWVEQAINPDGSVRSRLHIGATSGDRVVQEASYSQQALRPYRWDRGGLVVEVENIGLSYTPPFDPANGPVELVDPQTGVIRPLTMPSGCFFAARAVDGTVACQTQTGSATTLTFIKTDGTTQSTTLPRPGFNSPGNASFRPGAAATTLVIGGDTYDLAQPTVAGRTATGLLDVGGASALQPFGPAGIAPAAGEDWVWLEGGVMIGWGWLQAPATDSGVWLNSGDGTARRISAGQAFGVLN
jgi:hypothetical protein